MSKGITHFWLFQIKLSYTLAQNSLWMTALILKTTGGLVSYAQRFSRLSLSVLLALNVTVSLDSNAQSRSRKNPGRFVDKNYSVIIDRGYINRAMVAPLCNDKYVVQIDKKQRAVDKKEADSCDLGFREGAKMAERVGRSQGTTLGRIHGLSKGMDDGFDGAVNDSIEIAAGRRSITQLDFPSAAARASNVAEAAAYQSASSEVYSRFRSAVDNQSKPDNKIYSPVINYAGLTDGYEHDRQPLLNEEALFRQEFIRQGGLYQFRNEDFFEAREVSDLNQMDYWRVRGYRGNVSDLDSRFSSWKNQNLAFSNFVSGPIGSIYRNIGNGTRTEYRVVPKPVTVVTPAPTPAAPGASQPGRGGNGVKPVTGPIKPVETQPAPRETEIVSVLVQVDDSHYQRIFEEAFKRAYSSGVERAFAAHYHPAVDEAFPKGYYIGEAVGLSMAFQTGQIQEYNYRYQKDSIATYKDVYSRVYENTFESKFKERMNSAQPEVEGLVIAGDVNDGILRAGEKVAAQLVIANYGGAAKKVTISIYGDLAGSSKTMEYNLPALKRVTVTTDYLAQVATNKNPRERVQLGARVDSIARPINLEINNIVEIRGLKISELDAVEGTATVQVQLLNPSTATNPQSHQLKLSIAGHTSSMTETVEPLKGGERKLVQFSVTGVDPLLLINKGLSVDTVSTMSSEKLDSEVGSRQSANKTADLTKYYNQLVLGTENLAKPVVPAGTDAKLRLNDVQNQIIGEITSQLANKSYVDSNPWKNNPDSTYVGQLSKLYTLQQPKAPGYVNYYQGLGTVLWNMRLTFDQDSVFKQARDRYADIVKTFSKNEGKNKK
jgi:hypothetical protein